MFLCIGHKTLEGKVKKVATRLERWNGKTWLPVTKEIPEGMIDPYNNILAGSKYLAYLLKIFGRLDTALIAYNAGPGNVARAIAKIRGIKGITNGAMVEYVRKNRIIEPVEKILPLLPEPKEPTRYLAKFKMNTAHFLI